MSPFLLNADTVRDFLTHEAPWCASHGAEDGYLGAGLLYYAIVYSLRAKTAVCLGSGGGFVPRMMRQAQRDLQITQASRTILVDGNCPEAGWGAPTWLDPNSFFRKEFKDVELVLERTETAARTFFASNNLSIDYLHIDANHSFESCLADFVSYRPFLREGSIVTLHDTSFPAAGVKSVTEHLRRLKDCEVIDFSEWGAGIALVRITGNAETLQVRSLPTNGGEISEPVSILRHPNAPALEPPRTGWAYLGSEAFVTRYVLAAHYTKNCPMVIELGGGQHTIDRFLAGPHRSVVVIDPFLRDQQWMGSENKIARVTHLRARFQDLDFKLNRSREYGLIILGMELQGLESNNWTTLFNLVNNAAVTVVEFPTSWGVSQEQFRSLLQNTRTHEVVRLKLNLEGNDFGDLKNSWPPRCDRELHVLTPE